MARFDSGVSSDRFRTYNNFGQLVGYPGKTKTLAPSITQRTMVAFVFGQSNAGNFGGERHTAIGEQIFNFFGGEYYRAEDPLLGSAGFRGSVWTLMANKLIKDGAYDRVILIPAAVNGASVDYWREDGLLRAMFESRLKEAQVNRLAITHFLWHQGESDNPRGMDVKLKIARYKSGMKEIIDLTKKYFPSSKFFVSIASLCDYDAPISDDLERAQQQMISMDGVASGPNTDKLDRTLRFDDCHFSGIGLDKFSDAWVSAIKAANRAQAAAAGAAQRAM